MRILGEAKESCPVCKISLSLGSIGGRRIRYCERCRGMLASMDAFAAIVQELRSRRDVSMEASHPADWKDLERKIRCPQCDQIMDAHLYGGGGNVIIDACETCSMIWLDYSELDRIVRAADPGVPGRLTLES